MQNLNMDVKLETSEPSTKYQNIFMVKETLRKLAKHPVKALLKHYLSAKEYTTRKGFFHRYKHEIPREIFKSISKNTLTKIYQAYEETNALVVHKGQQNKLSYQYPANYPSESAQWLKVEGGYTIMNREELIYILENLTDSELNTYIVLKLIYEANGRPQEGFKTYFKVLRESHLNISQNTLKKSLLGLEEKKLIALNQITDKKDWKFSHVIINLNPISQILSPLIPKIESKKALNPKNCAHLNQAFEKSSLNQATTEPEQTTRIINFSEKNQSYKKADFNFYGLGEKDNKLSSPLEWRTIFFLLKATNFTFDQIQESVMRFSRFYFGCSNFRNKVKNPAAYLIHHLKTKNTIFLEPEWFLETLHNLDKKQNKQTKEQAEISNKEAYEHLMNAVKQTEKKEKIEDGIDYLAQAMANLDLAEKELNRKSQPKILVLETARSSQKINTENLKKQRDITLTKIGDLFTA